MQRASAFSLALLFTVGACADEPVDDRTDGTVQPGDGKADGTGVDVRSVLTPTAPVTATLAAVDRVGYVLYAGAGSTIDLEVTQAGSTTGLDTHLFIYGPRAADGSYAATVAEDTDSGFGKLSRLRGVALPAAGHYLVEVRLEPTSKLGKFRLAMGCTSGDCKTFQPVPGAREHTHWMDGAEYKALALQAYGVATRQLDAQAAAGLPATWTAVVDLDESVLSNETYETERAAIGAGFSAVAWTAWVERRAATAIPGAKAFLHHVHQLGGKVVAVSNRKAMGECGPTKDNLAALGLEIDAMLCKTDSSDKNPRFASIEDGTSGTGLPAMPIELFVGDNIQDFPALTQDVRTMGEDAFADFGVRFIQLPNPMYGSWQKNP